MPLLDDVYLKSYCFANISLHAADLMYRINYKNENYNMFPTETV